MSKKLEHSEDMKTWKTVGACEDKDAQKVWEGVQQWVEEVQPYGFFRLVDDTRTVEEIMNQIEK